MEPQVGSILEGKVTSIMKFGAFVALEGGGSGLVHISEIANTFVEDVHDHLQTGQAVKVLVLSAENGRVNLSIKKALPQQERRAPRPPRTGPQSGPRPAAAPGVLIGHIGPFFIFFLLSTNAQKKETPFL